MLQCNPKHILKDRFDISYRLCDASEVATQDHLLFFSASANIGNRTILKTQEIQIQIFIWFRVLEEDPLRLIKLIEFQHCIVWRYNIYFEDTCIASVSPDEEVSVEGIFLICLSHEVDLVHHDRVVIFQLHLRELLVWKLRVCQERLPHLLQQRRKPHVVQLLEAPEYEESVVPAPPFPHELLKLLISENDKIALSFKELAKLSKVEGEGSLPFFQSSSLDVVEGSHFGEDRWLCESQAKEQERYQSYSFHLMIIIKFQSRSI